MAKAIVELQHLVGKTIEAVADTWFVNGFRRVLVFTDGSFVCTDVRNEVVFGGHQKDTDVNTAAIAKYVRETAVKAGLITQAEFDKQLNVEKAIQEQAQEDSDRELYERLRARFEGKDKDADDSKKPRRRAVKGTHRTKTT